MIKYVLAWFPMLVIAILNGGLRQYAFPKSLSELNAHQISTLLGAFFVGIFIWFIVRKWPPSSNRQAILIGFTWMILTVIFETCMGLLIQGLSLIQILGEYNILQGKMWVLFLIWLTVAPWIFYSGSVKLGTKKRAKEI